MTYLVGIDVGGTFTDLVSYDEASRRLELVKVPTTPDSPDVGVLHALEVRGVDPGSIRRIVHGSTVSTNALLERTGSRVGLITTAGFEDVLEIGNTDRAHLYDLSWTRPEPLVPRPRRRGVRQRTTAAGDEIEALDESDVERALADLVVIGVDAIAVCFLNSYANPAHELRAREIIAAREPALPVSISSEVMNAIREFDRTSTVVVDAYVKPVMASYLDRLETGLETIGVEAALRVMQSSGGVMDVESTAELPVHTLVSGPAGGVVAAGHLAQRSGYAKVITLDIGGTSADVALIMDGRPRLTTETEVDFGIPVQVPMIDIETIGAGGGSIAWIDRGGRLKVGPRSAGARPGPACFDTGGRDATVTDANLVLGYLSPENYANGTIPLHPDLATGAIEANVATPLGLSLVEAACGIIEIVNANMRNLIRRVTVQQGLDPREFALVAFGGGGPVHAVAVARELGVSTVLVPSTPGVLSAYGMLLAIPRHDFVQSLHRPLHHLEWGELTSVASGLETRGRALLARSGAERDVVVEVRLDMQFERQNYTISVALDDGIRTASELRRAFELAYEQKFGYVMEDQPVELVNCRVSVSAPTVPLEPLPREVARTDQVHDRARQVYFGEHGEYRPCPVISRDSLAVGDPVPSPCIVEQPDTSVVVPPGVEAWVDEASNIVISIFGGGEHRPRGGRRA